MRPENFPEMATQIAEPFSPVIDGQLLTDQPGNLIANGDLRPHTPVFYTIQTDEGEMFVNLLFPTRIDQKRVQIKSGFLFLEASPYYQLFVHSHRIVR